MEQTKTRKFLIATHGRLATGIKSSLDIIIGRADNVFLIEAYIDENKSIEDELEQLMKNIGDDDELIAFTDLLGGSVTNQVLRYTAAKKIHVISGFNLALLIEILMADTATPVEEVIDAAIISAREQLVYVNKLITANAGDND
ncbi:MAG TPA: hypothetical protein VG738_22655 [Chitinophagaceae bacterium]|nr:hypothetical protein [Chitinophagaceae bacterium]